MRTTLTLDDDVAAILTRLQREQERSFKALVNEALRQGLRQMTAAPSHARYQTRAVDHGRSLIGSLDNVAEVLAVAEGERFR